MKAKLSLALVLLLGSVASSQPKHKKHHLAQRQLTLRSFVQLSDHDNDTDDIVPDLENKLFIQLKDHTLDTDDIPDNMDPVLVQTKDKVAIKDHNNDTDDIPDGMDPTYVQTSQTQLQTVKTRDHSNDTDDMPENMDPLNVALQDEDDDYKMDDEAAAIQLQYKKENLKWDQLQQ